jgi:putative FmdB family regulatory protein
MPIYEYRCSDCGFQDEYLQKISEPPLTSCPSCGKATFLKLVSAAGFQLKGSGWYQTDFRSSGKPAAAKTETQGASKPESQSEAKSDAKSDAKPETKGEAKAAPAKSPAAANSDS